jgi:integral membrane protein (TIGR01906 family)
MNEKKALRLTLSWVVTVLTPLVLLMISVRLLITPVFPQVEYRMPGFPEDPFGFTMADRLEWSAPSITYLVNNEGIDFLGDLTFDDGEPIYNANELSHMEDVKTVVTGMRIGLTVSAVVLLGIILLAVKQGWRREVLRAFRKGGWATVGLIAAILVFVAVAFDPLFTWFHKIFFQDGTWMFYTSDTLIRLFPMRFWQDAFIAVGLFSLIFAGLLIVLIKPKSKLKAE